MANIAKPWTGWRFKDLDSNFRDRFITIENAVEELTGEGGGNTSYASLTENNTFEGVNYFQYPIRFGSEGSGNNMSLGIESNSFVLRDYNEVVMFEIGNTVASLATDNEGVGISILKLGNRNIMLVDSSLENSDNVVVNYGSTNFDMAIKAERLSFYEGTPVDKPTLEGTTDSEKLQSVIDALVSLGLVNDIEI